MHISLYSWHSATTILPYHPDFLSSDEAVEVLWHMEILMIRYVSSPDVYKHLKQHPLPKELGISDLSSPARNKG